jgi:hypothetical protein
MRHGAMLLCSALNLIFEHGRISGSGKVNGAEAKWTSAFFPFEECQNARTGYEFLKFPYRRGPKKLLQAAASSLRARRSYLQACRLY